MHTERSASARRQRTARPLLAALVAGVMALAVASPGYAADPAPEQTFWQMVDDDTADPLDAAQGITTASAAFTLTGKSGATLHLANQFDQTWTATFAPRNGQSLQVGTYQNIRKAPTATSPGLNLDVSGHQCGTVEGEFTVHELTRSGAGDVTTFSATYEIHCDSKSTLVHGSVAYRATTVGPSPTWLQIWSVTPVYRGQDVAVFWWLRSTGQQDSAVAPTISWQRTDAEGTQPLPDRTGIYANFVDTIGTSTTTYEGSFAGTSEFMPSSGSVTVETLMRPTTLQVHLVDGWGQVGVTQHFEVQIRQDGGGPPLNVPINYTVTNSQGTTTGTVTTNTSGETTLNYVPDAGGPTTWAFSYAGDDLRLPTSSQFDTTVRYRPTPLTIALSHRKTQVGKKVTVTVSLGETRTNRFVDIYAARMTAPDSELGDLIFHVDLTGKSSFTFTRTVESNVVLSAVFAGDSQYAAKTVKTTTWAKPTVSVKMLGATGHSGKYSVFNGVRAWAKAHVSPNEPKGACASFQAEERRNGRWTHVAISNCFRIGSQSNVRVKLTGKWKKDVPFRMRAEARANDVYSRATSPWVYFRLT